MNFLFRPHIKNDFGSFLSSIGKGICQTFRSKFHIFVGSVSIKYFAEQVLKPLSGRKKFLEPFYSLLYGLEESRNL